MGEHRFVTPSGSPPPLLARHTVFTSQGGETFSFSGDDDVFVFTNKKKVVDLGRVRTAAAGPARRSPANPRISV